MDKGNLILRLDLDTIRDGTAKICTGYFGGDFVVCREGHRLLIYQLNEKSLKE